MTTAILITRPDHDLITTYLYHWTIYVINEAARRGIKVLDLKKDKANYKIFKSYIKKHQPTLIFFNGHGSVDSIAGYNDEILIRFNYNEKLLAQKIVYARSCDAGGKLGLSCIKKGTLAFIGYRKKYSLGYTPFKVTKPLEDEVARLFLEPSNLIPTSLLKGNKIKDAYRKSQEAMLRNIRFMLSTRATSAQKDAVPYLWVNRKYQVVYGNEEAHI